MKLYMHSRKLSHLNGILLRNPLVTMGCFLALAVVPVTSLRAGAALSLLLTLVSVPTYVGMSALGRFLKGVWRTVAAPLAAAVLFIPAFFITQAVFPDVGERFGFYLPIIVFDVFFTSRCSTLAPRVRPNWMLVDSVSCCFGLAIVFCLLGCVRELVGSGTIWGITVYYGETFPALLLPFGGFFALAFLMALSNLLLRLVRHSVRTAVEHRKKEVREHE